MKNFKTFINILILAVPVFFIISFLTNALEMESTVFCIAISTSFVCCSILLSLFLQIIFHESGHLIFGLLTGYKFLSFRIWKIAIAKIGGNFSLRFFQIAGSGGQCLMAPPEGKNYDNYPFVLYNLGGGIMNISLATVAFFLAFNTKNVFFSSFLWSFSFVGIYLGLTNIIPVKNIPNDGTNLKSMRKSKDSRRAFYDILLLNKLAMEKKTDRTFVKNLVDVKNYEDFDEPLVQAVLSENISLEIEDENYLHAIEFADWLLARKNMTFILKNAILMDKFIIYMLLSDEENANKILSDASFLKSLKTSGISENEMCKFMYYTLIEKDEKKAHDALEKFEKLAKNYLIEDDIEFDRKLIERTLEKRAWSDKMMIFDSVESTNSLLKEMANDLENGTSVLSKSQTAGRGQKNHKFFSPDGGMYLSVLIRPRYDAYFLKYLTARAAVAVSESIKKATGKKVLIKWINDLIFEEKKVGGILTESKLDSSGNIEYAIIGIGINIKTSEVPDEISKIYGSLNSNDTKKTINAILTFLMPELENLNEPIDLETFLKKYNALLYRKNMFTTVDNDGEIIEGITISVDENLNLVMEIDSEFQRFSYDDTKIINAFEFERKSLAQK